jgi:hypothetical protein
MSFFGIVAVPMAMNLLGGLFTPKPPAMNPSYFSQMNKTMSSTSKEMQKMWEKQPEPKKLTFDFDVPEPSKDSITKFESMQTKHEGEKTALLNKFTNELKQAKEDFFSKNHYDTKAGADGKEQLALDKQGKPVVKEGPETPPQRVARETHEVAQKSEMFTKHAEEKHEFVKDQKTQLTTFLDTNKFQLDNPGIQGELQKMIIDGQKKGAKLQDKHESEFFKVDLPEVGEIQEKAENGNKEFKELQAKQMKEQANSREARDLSNYQNDLVALLDAKRAEARETRKSELFLVDPRKFMKNPPRQDISTVLPMNFVAALEQFGINELPS